MEQPVLVSASGNGKDRNSADAGGGCRTAGSSRTSDWATTGVGRYAARHRRHHRAGRRASLCAVSVMTGLSPRPPTADWTAAAQPGMSSGYARVEELAVARIPLRGGVEHQRRSRRIIGRPGRECGRRAGGWLAPRSTTSVYHRTPGAGASANAARAGLGEASPRRRRRMRAKPQCITTVVR